MPVYEYCCKICAKEFTDIKLVADRDDIVCPGCNGECERKPAAPPFHLKGEGWTEKSIK